MTLELRGQRIAVTGGAGFLGRFVTDELLAAGADATRILVVRSMAYDLRDKNAVRRMYEDLRPDVVIHLAAVVGGIGANQKNPGRYLYENLVMGSELIEEGRLYDRLKKFVGIGTVCAYPKLTPAPFHEDALWDGYPEETNAPYGLAKKMMLAQLQAYRAQYAFPGIFLLPVNLYGPHDNFDSASSHVIPALIRKIDHAVVKHHDEVVLWGDGTPTREFVHVRDAARGIVLATMRYADADPVNIGTGDDLSILSLAQLIGELLGFAGRFVTDPSRPNGQPCRRLDVTRAKERFGFEATVALRAGLAETIAWWASSDARARALEAGS